MLDVATGTVTWLAETDGSDRLSVINFSPEGERILASPNLAWGSDHSAARAAS